MPRRSNTVLMFGLGLAVTFLFASIPAQAQCQDITLKSDWKLKKGAIIPLYVQATHTASLPQKVTVSGCGMGTKSGERACTGTQEAISDGATKFGTQFMNWESHVEYTENFSYTYKVCVWNKDTAGNWVASTFGKHAVMPVGEHALFAVIPTNDSGGDKDFNDAVVMISMWAHSSD